MPGERVKVNFGQEKFLFDVKAFVEVSVVLIFVKFFEQEEQVKLRNSILQEAPPSVNQVNSLIRSYLYHSGLGNTLRVFEESIQVPLSERPPKMNERKQISELVQSGKAEDAMAIFKSSFQECYNECVASRISFMIQFHGQCVIEFIHCGDIEKALNYTQQHLSQFLYVNNHSALVEQSKNQTLLTVSNKMRN